jgi:protein-export membrane protein SecD
MRKFSASWLVVIAGITILCLYMIWPDNPGLFGRPIEVRPGLDIQGGLRVLMAAQGTDVTVEQMDEVRRVIDRRVNALGVAEPIVQVAGTSRIIVELPGIQNPDTAIAVIQQTALLEFVNFSAVGGCIAPMPEAGQYVLTNRQVDRQRDVGLVTPVPPTDEAPADATEPAPTDTAEPDTTPTALEPTTEPEAEATTEPVTEPTAEPETDVTPEPTAEGPAAPDGAAADTGLGVPGSRSNPLLNPCTGQPFETVMTGAGLRDAQARIGGQAQNQWVVAFQLNPGSPEAQAFASFTSANIGQPLAIVLDGEVLSAPTIQARIDDSGEITGAFTQEDARTLSLQLRSGALPVSLSIESIERVGASLGAESVEKSVRAGLLGIVTIFAFLLVYYRVGGLAAALALILFGLINFALYKFIPVTLTLSAVTGFLIAIGSAIDGNILIFERVKEELRAGRNLPKAIELGFARAWRTIRDSNISTIMIALILYFFGGQFGASAVRGFAVTLILGLLLNLFTAVFVTRIFLNTILQILGERARTINLFGQ